MIPGFLSRAPLMFDVVSLAMVVVIPVLTWSIYLIKRRRAFLLHKRLQVALGAALFIAVTLFEIDIRLHPNWWVQTEASSFSRTFLERFLYFHLCFAISTTILWIVTLTLALRRFPSPPRPSEHSRTHIALARLASLTMYCTAVTGWIFYWMAFVSE